MAYTVVADCIDLLTHQESRTSHAALDLNVSCARLARQPLNCLAYRTVLSLDGPVVNLDYDGISCCEPDRTAVVGIEDIGRRFDRHGLKGSLSEDMDFAIAPNVQATPLADIPAAEGMPAVAHMLAAAVRYSASRDVQHMRLDIAAAVPVTASGRRVRVCDRANAFGRESSCRC